MTEHRSSYRVDAAQAEDLAEIQQLHIASQRFVSPCGTPFVKPLRPAELAQLLPRTLLLKHGGVVVGKLHATDIRGPRQTVQIGGFVIEEDHHDSQQAKLLLTETLVWLRASGYRRAVAITAAEGAKRLFAQCGGRPNTSGRWRALLLANALNRYAPAERDQVQLVEFSLGNSPRRQELVK